MIYTECPLPAASHEQYHRGAGIPIDRSRAQCFANRPETGALSGGVCLQSRIRSVHKTAAAAAMEALHSKSFGQVGDSLDSKLKSLLQRDLGDALNRNEVQSSRTCGHLEADVRPAPPPASSLLFQI